MAGAASGGGPEHAGADGSAAAGGAKDATAKLDWLLQQPDARRCLNEHVAAAAVAAGNTNVLLHLARCGCPGCPEISEEQAAGPGSSSSSSRRPTDPSLCVLSSALRHSPLA